MDLRTTLTRLGIALALGLLVGLQRQRAESRVAGVRTFALITLFGTMAGLTASSIGPWLVAAGALALVALLVIGNILKLDGKADPDPGMTTEVAALLMYAVGVYLAIGHTTAAVATAGAIVLLLHLKHPLHRAIGALGEKDMAAIVQFALITLVILPVLPDRTYGPFDVLNPRQIWLMVVLIVSMNLAGYVAAKRFGADSGALLGGLVGGLVSSTAATIAYARRSRGAGAAGADATSAGANAQAAVATAAIVIASTVAVVRVLVEVAIVAPSHFAAIAAPISAMFGWMLVLSGVAWSAGRTQGKSTLPESGNPAELKPAVLFGAVYAIVLLAAAFATEHFGTAGLFPVALLSGLTDVDAITLSSANLAAQGRLEAPTAWRLILLALLANLVFKASAACVLGSPAMRRRVVVLFGLAVTGGAAILLLWP